MDNTLFQEIARFGFKPVDQKVCVGTWRNYAVALNNYAGKAFYYYVAIRLPKASRDLQKAVVAAYKAAGLKNASVLSAGPNSLHGIYSLPQGDVGANFAAFLDLLTATLAQNGAAPANTCAVTGAANPDSLCFMMNPSFPGFQPVSGSAVRQDGYEAQAKVEENENNGSYAMGILGALLGMLVGVAVNVLTIVFLQRYFSILFALVPVAAMFGYKLFKGKLNKVSIIIVLVLSVIAVPLMEFLALAFTIAKEYDIPVGMALDGTSQVFFQAEALKELGPEMLKMLLFMVLGVFISFSFLRNQLNSTQVKGSQLQLDSMQPNPLYQASVQSDAEPTAAAEPGISQE